MKKLILVLFFPASVFAQSDVKVKICSNINYFGGIGRVIYPLICSENTKVGFAINVGVREIQGELGYYNIVVQRHGIGNYMDSSRLVFYYEDGGKYELKSYLERNTEEWSNFDEGATSYNHFLKKKIESIEFINLTTNDRYLYKLKPEQKTFFKNAWDDIRKNKFYVGECI